MIIPLSARTVAPSYSASSDVVLLSTSEGFSFERGNLRYVLQVTSKRVKQNLDKSFESTPCSSRFLPLLLYRMCQSNPIDGEHILMPFFVHQICTTHPQVSSTPRCPYLYLYMFLEMSHSSILEKQKC